MSWQGAQAETLICSSLAHYIPRRIAYVDNNLIGTGKVSHAAILGQKGGVWAASTGFTVSMELIGTSPIIAECTIGDGCAYIQLSTEEQNAAVQAFNNPDNTLQTGVRLAGNKYFALSADSRHIMGKKQVSG